MGVFDKVGDGPSPGNPEGRPYVCMGCEASLEVQYHSCPVCGGYDVRRAKWLRE